MRYQPFDQPPELSSDLEWMLQSGQGERAMLAEALVREYYAPVYRLAYALLLDEDAADQAAKDTFRQALLNVSQYRSDRGARFWLFRLAWKVCRRALYRAKLRALGGKFQRLLKKPSRPGGAGRAAQPPALSSREGPSGREAAPDIRRLDALGETERAAALLHYVHGLGAPEIGRILGESEREVLVRLANARQVIVEILARVEVQAEGLTARMARLLEQRWPERQMTAGEVRWTSEAVLGEAEKGAPRQRRFIAFSETLWVWLVAILAIGLIWGTERLLPERSPPARPAAVGATRTPSPAPRVSATPTAGNHYTEVARAMGRPESVRTRTPPRRTSTPVPTQPVIMAYLPEPGESLESIAAKFGIPLEELKSHNSVIGGPEIQSGQQVNVPIRPAAPGLTPTRVTPPTHRLAPLEAGASPEQIYQFLLLSERLWNTLWADAQFIRYGPNGYVGPPLEAREQAWVSQPDRAKMLVGPLLGQPVFHNLAAGGRFYQMYPASNTGTLFETGNPLNNSLLGELIHPGDADWVNREGRFQAVRSEAAAGREAVVVDWSDGQGRRQRRLWVDARTGVILRLQRFGGPEGESLLEETVLTAIEYDRDMAPELFDPLRVWNGGYAQDSGGIPLPTDLPYDSLAADPAPGHERLPSTPAPAGFDPASSRLTFQYDPDPVDAPGLQQADLFADGYHLGGLEFPGPWRAHCSRSADGRQIAFAGSGEQRLDFFSQWEPSNLYWLDLSDPAEVHSLPPGSEVFNNIAFAPDGSRLAFSGILQGRQGLYILDTSTGETSRLSDLEAAFSLVWSPDGEFLAMIGYPGVQAGWWPEAIVMRAGSGEIVYRTQIEPLDIYRLYFGFGEPDPEWPAPDWPGREWGVEFPALWSGLEGCVEAPGDITTNGE